jgi:hypothetical protein
MSAADVGLTATRVPSAPTGRRPPAERARAALALARRLPALALIGVIRVYQLVISPLTPPSCRYYPSCSTYAVVALRRHGLLRGGWLAVRRLARCHPWTPGGVDDVPPARPRTAAHPVAPHAHGAD